MKELLPFIIVGLASGSVYGLAGVGLVLTYKTTGIMNLGYGALAAAAAYIFYYLHVEHGLAWPLAMVVSVVIFGTLCGLAYERFARMASRMTTALQVAGTVGIILVVTGLALQWKGTEYTPFDQFLPRGGFTLAGASVGWDQVILIVVGLLATAGLYVLLRATRIGFAMRAVVDDPDLVALSGTSPTRVRQWASIIGLLLACLAGVLLGPSTSLNVTVLTQLVVQAFGAAAIGYFSNLPLTYAGGILIGVASAVTTKYVSADGPLGGLPTSLPFIVLFVALLVVKREKLVQRIAAPARLHESWSVPVRIQTVLGGIAAIVLLLVPTFAGTYMSSWTVGASYIVLFLSLGLLVKTSNQTSLAHAAFAAMGASTFAHLAPHMPWALALVLTGLIVLPIGALVAIPAVRVSGVYLALATLGFGIMVQYIFFQTRIMFGPNQAAALIPRPAGSLSGDTGFYYTVLGIAFVVTAGMVALHRTRLGRLLRGLGDSRLALSTLGMSPNLTLALVFALSASVAAIFGVLYGATLYSASGESFVWNNSLTYLVLLSIVAGTLPWYAIVAALSLGVLPSYLSGFSFNWFTVLFGAFAILHAMVGPPAAPPWLKQLLLRYGERAPASGTRTGTGRFGRITRRKPPVVEATNGHRAPETVSVAPPIEPGLVVTDLTMRFTGVLALDGLSLSAPKGRITGLIGPNGAGKTTTFNACSGLIHPTGGTVTLFGEDVSSVSPGGRARRGLGRTFQRMQLFESLSVQENVALGREAGIVGNNILAQVITKPGDRKTIDDATERALEICGITELRRAHVASLSTGQRRLVELARCLAGDFALLLLDEPSSGLDRRETERFGEVLETVVRERGIGILLVEHDMSLVMRVCGHIHVLDFGKHIFEGTPEQVSSSPLVRAAYLGTDLSSVADSGGVAEAPRLALD